jgi:ABC-type sulfate/molybdate transport systems ATPase subunit
MSDVAPLDFDVSLAAGDRAMHYQGRLEAPGTLVLFGPSGAGKTLTLRALAGLVRPRQGHIRQRGRTLFDGTVCVPPQARRVGYIPQQGCLFPHLSVAENVGFGVPRRARAERVGAILKELDLAPFATRRPASLSGGEAQRVAVARALAPQPETLLLDEPFSSLDRSARRELRVWFAAHVRHRNLAVVLVTHDEDEALELGDRVVVIDGRRTVGAGAPRDVLSAPAP